MRAEFEPQIMKRNMKYTLLLGAAIAGLSAWFYTSQNDTSSDFYISNYSPRVSAGNKAEANGMIEYLQNVRGTVNGFTADDIQNSIAKAKNMESSRAGLGIEFSPIGPMNIGGRTRAVVIDNQDPKRIYAGAVTGGIFLSLNGGNSWSTSFDQKQADGTYQPWIQISCMAQGADGTLYAGTGCDFEGNGSNTPDYTGIGIYVSKDRGVTWSIPESSKRVTELGPDYNDFGKINDLAAHPTNGSIVAAATNLGLRLTTDGGATWKKDVVCESGNTIRAKALSVKFSKDGDKLYVAYNNNDFYVGTNYTADCGFTKMDSVRGVGGRVILSTSPTNNDVCYAGMANAAGGDLVDLRITQDGGKTWNSFNPPVPTSLAHYDLFGKRDVNAGQAYYDFILKACVDPDDNTKDRLFLGGVQMWRFDGNWTMVAFGGGGGNTHSPFALHADHHMVTQDPKNPSTIYFGNDGGVWKSLDGGVTFFDINKGYNTTQFYDVDIAKEDFVIGGTQDNGNIFVTPMRPGNPDYGLVTYNDGILNGDGFDNKISNISDIKYTSAQYGNLGKSRISAPRGSGACLPYCGLSGFFTKLAFWESEFDPLSKDSVVFEVDTTEQEVGLGTGIRSTYEDTIMHPQASAKVIHGSLRIGTVLEQLVYDGKGGFTGNGTGTYDEATGIFKVVFNTPPQLNARINAYYTANYDAGSIIYVESKTDKMPIKHVLRTSLSPGDKLKVQDPIQSLIAMQSNSNCPYDTTATGIENPCTDVPTSQVPQNAPGIIMSRKAIVFGEAPVWFRFATSGGVGTMDFSSDGNSLYYGSGRTVYRIKGLSGVYNQSQANALIANGGTKNIFAGGGGNCTKIVENPSNPNELLVTSGGWGNDKSVYVLSYNKNTDSYTPTDKTGNLAEIKCPVYSAMYDVNDTKKVLLATDIGIFSTADITADPVVWSKEDLGNIPVFDIVQQQLNHSKASNHEMIYLGTFGRGLYKSGSLVGQREFADFGDKGKWNTSLKVYPNPVSDRVQVEYTLGNADNVYFNIIDMRGNIIRSVRPASSVGENNTSIGVSDLPMGTYFLTLNAGNESKVAKIVKVR